MLDLNNRQKHILELIINNYRIEVEEIAIQHNVSIRTIYRDIKKIKEELSPLNLTLVNNKNKYHLKGKQNDLLKLMNYISSDYRKLTPLDRKKIIVAELLTSKEPIKLDYFAKKFNITSPAVSYYLTDIRKWLKKNDIEVISTPGVGVKINGTEENIRKATADFIYEYIDLKAITEYIHQKYDTKDSQKTHGGKLLDILDISIISNIEKSLLLFQKKYNYPIIDRIYINLTIHIALAIKRIKAGEKITLEANALNKLKRTKEFKMATILTRYIEKFTQVNIPIDEIGYITMHLLGNNYQSTNEQKYASLIKQITNKTIREASKKLHVNFREDPILVDGLTNHFTYTLSRIKSKLPVRNPILKEIKTKYRTIYNIIDDVLCQIGNRYNLKIPEDEVGYIAIHFAASIERMRRNFKKYNILAVCSSGIGSSRMLLSKLQNYPQLNIKGVCSLGDLHKTVNKHNIDLIISTIPLSNSDLNIRTVVVTPLLLEQDIESIKTALNISNLQYTKDNNDTMYDFNKKENIKSVAKYGYNVINLINNTKMLIHKSNSEDDLIRELLKPHYKAEKITKIQEEILFKSLIQRNKLAPIILPGKKFVLYHCVNDDVEDVLVTIGKFNKPIRMKNILNKITSIYVSFLLVGPNKKSTLEILGDISSVIIEDNNLVKKLYHSTSSSETIKYLEDTLYLKFHKKIRGLIN